MERSLNNNKNNSSAFIQSKIESITNGSLFSWRNISPQSIGAMMMVSYVKVMTLDMEFLFSYIFFRSSLGIDAKTESNDGKIGEKQLGTRPPNIDHDASKHGGYSVFVAIMFIAGENAGAGILALPKMLVGTGA